MAKAEPKKNDDLIFLDEDLSKFEQQKRPEAHEGITLQDDEPKRGLAKIKEKMVKDGDVVIKFKLLALERFLYWAVILLLIAALVWVGLSKTSINIGKCNTDTEVRLGEETETPVVPIDVLVEEPLQKEVPKEDPIIPPKTNTTVPPKKTTTPPKTTGACKGTPGVVVKEIITEPASDVNHTKLQSIIFDLYNDAPTKYTGKLSLYVYTSRNQDIQLLMPYDITHSTNPQIPTSGVPACTKVSGISVDLRGLTPTPPRLYLANDKSVAVKVELVKSDGTFVSDSMTIDE